MSSNNCALPSGSRVWSYLRVSGDEQADRGLPIAGQRRAHEDYAAEHGLAIVRWFVDEAKSGGSAQRAPAKNHLGKFPVEMLSLRRSSPFYTLLPRDDAYKAFPIRPAIYLSED